MKSLVWRRDIPHHEGTYRSGVFTIRRVSDVSSSKPKWQIELDIPPCDSLIEAKQVVEKGFSDIIKCFS